MKKKGISIVPKKWVMSWWQVVISSPNGWSEGLHSFWPAWQAFQPVPPHAIGRTQECQRSAGSNLIRKQSCAVPREGQKSDACRAVWAGWSVVEGEKEGVPHRDPQWAVDNRPNTTTFFACVACIFTCAWSETWNKYACCRNVHFQQKINCGD